MRKEIRLQQIVDANSLNRIEFIKLIIEKKSLDKEVFKKSLEIDNFPIARQVINKINGNTDTDILIKSNNFVEIKSAQANLIANLVNFLKDPLLKSETKKFLDELVDLKVTGYSLTETKKSKSTRRRNNSKLSKKENIDELILNHENSQTNKSLEKKEVKNRDSAYKKTEKSKVNGIDNSQKNSPTIIIEMIYMMIVTSIIIFFSVGIAVIYFDTKDIELRNNYQSLHTHSK